MNYPIFSYGNDNFTLLNRGKITVMGRGRVSASPDTAILTIGVTSEGDDLQRIQEENALISSRVIKTLLSHGIQRDNIKTQSYTIEPLYDYTNGNQIFKGYRVSNILITETSRLGDIGAIIDDAVASGANNIQGISFSVKNPEIYYNEALRLALRNAQSKALTLAQEMNIKIDRVPISIQEQVAPVPYGSSALIKASAATPILPGTLDIIAELEAIFKYI